MGRADTDNDERILYQAATRNDVETTRRLLGDRLAHELFVLYFSKHPAGTQKPVLYFLSSLPPLDRVVIWTLVLKIDKRNVWVYDKLALALLKIGRAGVAKELLSKALNDSLISQSFYSQMQQKLVPLISDRQAGRLDLSTSYAEALAKLASWVKKEDEARYQEFLNIYRVFCALDHHDRVSWDWLSLVVFAARPVNPEDEEVTPVSNKTIEQLARAHNLDLRDISKAARQILGLSEKEASDPHHLLSPLECRRIRQAFNVSDPDPADTAETEEPSIPRQLLPLFRRDPVASATQRKFSNLKYSLWVHPSVSDVLRQYDALYRRLGIVLQHLGAHGRTGVVKGCKDPANHGWRRSPLGGHHGNHYYLWWTIPGSPQSAGLGLPPNAILVRAVRHHDNHDPLPAGILTDYLEFCQPELEDASLVGSPWTEQQVRFVQANDPVRLAIGRPGSGKTTALWRAIDARSNQLVLYLSWSRKLTDYADEHFQSFAPRDVAVISLDFARFLSELSGADVPEQTLPESFAAFEQSVERLGPQVFGPWAGRRWALYAEMRAYLLGRAMPDTSGDLGMTAVARLTDSEYFELRGKAIGQSAVEALLRVFGYIEEDVPKLFPEFTHTLRAIAQLRRDSGFPSGLAKVDRIVADEVQDLTLIEIMVIVELCRAIERQRGWAPGLLMAGDEGQTVRPSGFDWGSLSNLLSRSLATPSKFQLEENLRCPNEIASVIQQVTDRYETLHKGLRPAKQGGTPASQHVDARLFHVDSGSVSETVELINEFDANDVLVIVPYDDLPEWLPEECRDVVLTPAQAKGLEYQSICVLDPGKVLALFSRTDLDAVIDALEKHERRRYIDQLRVAISRATETLLCVDTDATDEQCNLSRELMGLAASCNSEDIVMYLKQADATPEERVLTWTQEAETVVQEMPRRAWRRAYQATRLLGNPELPNGVSDGSVRTLAHNTLVGIAAQLLVRGAPERVQRRDVIAAARDSLRALNSEGAEDAFEWLIKWSNSDVFPPFQLLELAMRPGYNGDWLRKALVLKAQLLRRQVVQYASQSSYAEWYDGDVEGWLRLTGLVGEINVEARKLRCIAAEALLKASKLEAAQRVHSLITPEDFRLTGCLREAEGALEDAAEAFERAEVTSDALRLWRKLGNWERASSLAAGDEKADLDWLLNFEAAVTRRPEGHSDRLTQAERERLLRVINGMKETPTSRDVSARLLLDQTMEKVLLDD